MSLFTQLIFQLSKISPEQHNDVNLGRVARKRKLERKSQKPTKNRKTLPPFQRKTYPEGIYKGILKEKGLLD